MPNLNPKDYWQFKGLWLDAVPEGVFGFVYMITNLDTGRFYIGKKQFYSTRKVKKGKKELAAMTDMRGSKVKYVTKESKWREYTGSCKELNEDIKKGANVVKEILHLCESKALLTYYETKYQFCERVIEVDSYNDNINGKYYRKIFE